jgi:hypothetical protein
MPWTLRWTISNPGASAGAIGVDVDRESILVADGWGVAFASLQVRRIDAKTGECRAATRTRASVRAYGRSDPNGLFIVGDKRLWLVDPASLERRAEYAERVPRYVNGIVALSALGSPHIVALRAPKTLVEFDLVTSRARKVSKAIPLAMEMVGARLIAVLADGSVVARTGAWTLVGRFPTPCFDATIDPTSGAVAALEGEVRGAYDAEGNAQNYERPRSQRVHLANVCVDFASVTKVVPIRAQGLGIASGLLIALAPMDKANCATLALDSLDEPMRLDQLHGRFAGFAGPYGIVTYAIDREHDEMSLSLFTP